MPRSITRYKRTLITKIVNNVQGFDLNPLAVLASKANYLIAMAEFLRYRPKEGIEIPVYLADSIAVSRRMANRTMGSLHEDERG